MAKLILIKIGSTGKAVKDWQIFLRGQNLYFGNIDGIFGEKTLFATIAFQNKHQLQPDGIVGIKTYGAAAMRYNFGVIVDTRTDITGDNWPPRSDFDPISEEDKQNLFGKLEWASDPQPGNPERITITNNWETTNLKTIVIPQLKAIHPSGKATIHKKIENQILNLFKEWEDKRLMHLVLTWDGVYDPRFIRGPGNNLSCHAFAIAFDINVEWNALGTVPALVGQKGSVRELVETANNNGFFWGGHFNGRKDGMHFEAAKII